MKKLTFYFDYLSPYAYLAWKALPGFCQTHQLELEPIPVVLGVLLNHSGQLGPAEIPAKRKYTFRDVLYWAQQAGLKISFPPNHPFNPLLPLRLTCLLAQEKPLELNALIEAIFDLAWVQSQDIAQADVLAPLAQQFGLNLEAAVAPEVKQVLKNQTEQAIQLGVFGVPTFIVENQLFWGYDRMGLLAAYLQGQLQIDEALYQAILSRPAGIQRRG